MDLVLWARCLTFSWDKGTESTSRKREFPRNLLARCLRLTNLTALLGVAKYLNRLAQCGLAGGAVALRRQCEDGSTPTSKPHFSEYVWRQRENCAAACIVSGSIHDVPCVAIAELCGIAPIGGGDSPQPASIAAAMLQLSTYHHTG